MPMFDVPHLTMALDVDDDGMLSVDLDIIAKEDLAYSQDYLDNYYGGETEKWYTSFMSSPLVKPKAAPTNMRGRVLVSPVRCSATMPNTEESMALLAGACDALVDRWLGWLDEATEIARVRRGTMLSRDKILRRMSWAVLSTDPTYRSLGEKGADLAAAIAGPSDTPYTGQYS
ncbi:unnamed protein product [Phaeothamnion confervicola]